MEGINPFSLLDNLEYQERAVVGFYSCNKAEMIGMDTFEIWKKRA